MPPAQDPFLSASCAKSSLPSQDARIGLAAHDLAQLANAPNVVLTLSPPRRLADVGLTLALAFENAGAGAKAELESADRYAVSPRSSTNPLITPVKPVQPRPLRTSASRRSASRSRDSDPRPVCGLRARILCSSITSIPSAPKPAAERGHRGSPRYRTLRRRLTPNELSRLLDEELRWHGIAPERRAADRERLLTSISALIAWFAERSSRGAVIYRERLRQDARRWRRSSRVADRYRDRALITSPSSTSRPARHRATNRSIAASARSFCWKPPCSCRVRLRMRWKATPTELIYCSSAAQSPPPIGRRRRPVPQPKGDGVTPRSAEALRKRGASILFKPRVQFLKPYDEYDLLARRKEWADEVGDE